MARPGRRPAACRIRKASKQPAGERLLPGDALTGLGCRQRLVCALTGCLFIVSQTACPPGMNAMHPSQKLRFKPRRRSALSRKLKFDPLEDRRMMAAGDLDPTFGSGGIVFTNVSSFQDSAESIAVQPDGKLVVAGGVFSAKGSDGGAIAVLRYNASGDLDSSFGIGGTTITDVNAKRFDRAYSVAVDARGTPATNPHYGKIYVAGTVDVGTSPGIADHAFCLLRYLPNGALDTSFGGGKAKGKVITNFTASDEWGYRLAIQSDGKIVVAGGGAAAGGAQDIVLARYTTGGLLDSSFGNQGKVVTDAGIVTSPFGRGLALQSDGKILVQAGSDAALVIARYNGNGSLDGAFGTNGLATIAGVQHEALAVQADGGIVAAGGGWTVSRLLANGALDSGFGDGGTVVTGVAGVAKSVAIAADGKIVVAGATIAAGGTNEDFAVVRLNVDGSLDASFGLGGLAIAAVGPYHDRAMGLAIGGDGKIAVAGHGGTAFGGDPAFDRGFAVARFLGDSTASAARTSSSGDSGSFSDNGSSGDIAAVDAVFHEASTGASARLTNSRDDAEDPSRVLRRRK